MFYFVLSGVGYGICLVSTFVGMYYNTIIAWGVFYMFASFRSEVPWAGCNNPWNTEQCMSLSTNFNKSLITNFTLTASDEYYKWVLYASLVHTNYFVKERCSNMQIILQCFLRVTEFLKVSKLILEKCHTLGFQWRREFIIFIMNYNHRFKTFKLYNLYHLNIILLRYKS